VSKAPTEHGYRSCSLHLHRFVNWPIAILYSVKNHVTSINGVIWHN
jgi:hypothetical protein